MVLNLVILGCVGVGGYVQWCRADLWMCSLFPGIPLGCWRDRWEQVMLLLDWFYLPVLFWGSQCNLTVRTPGCV